MANVPYVNYTDMKEFYSIQEVCELFKISKEELKKKTEQYKIEVTPKS